MVHLFITINKGKQELGKEYLAGFMKRNGDLVKAKKGVKFDSKRADRCTYQNFQLMYQNAHFAVLGFTRSCYVQHPSWILYGFKS